MEVGEVDAFDSAEVEDGGFAGDFQRGRRLPFRDNVLSPSHSLDVFDYVGDVGSALGVPVGGGGGTYAKVRQVGPVEEVVPAFEGGFCKVGYFVLLEAGTGEAVYRKVVHLPVGLFVDRFDIAAVEGFFQRGVLLVGEAIGADVLKFQVEGFFQGLLPGLQGGAWDGEYKVNTDVSEARIACGLDGGVDAGDFMRSAEESKPVFVEGLCADTQPVDADGSQFTQRVLIDLAGIDFDGELVRVDRARCEGFGQFQKQALFKTAGAAASDVDGFNIRRQLAAMEFAQKGVDEGGSIVASDGLGIEAAVSAFGGAEGHVDIEAGFIRFMLWVH